MRFEHRLCSGTIKSLSPRCAIIRSILLKDARALEKHGSQLYAMFQADEGIAHLPASNDNPDIDKTRRPTILRPKVTAKVTREQLSATLHRLDASHIAPNMGAPGQNLYDNFRQQITNQGTLCLRVISSEQVTFLLNDLDPDT